MVSQKAVKKEAKKEYKKAKSKQFQHWIAVRQDGLPLFMRAGVVITRFGRRRLVFLCIPCEILWTLAIAIITFIGLLLAFNAPASIGSCVNPSNIPLTGFIYGVVALVFATIGHLVYLVSLASVIFNYRKYVRSTGLSPNAMGTITNSFVLNLILTGLSALSKVGFVLVIYEFIEDVVGGWGSDAAETTVIVLVAILTLFILSLEIFAFVLSRKDPGDNDEELETLRDIYRNQMDDLDLVDADKSQRKAHKAIKLSDLEIEAAETLEEERQAAKAEKARKKAEAEERAREAKAEAKEAKTEAKEAKAEAKRKKSAEAAVEAKEAKADGDKKDKKKSDDEIEVAPAKAGSSKVAEKAADKEAAEAKAAKKAAKEKLAAEEAAAKKAAEEAAAKKAAKKAAEEAAAKKAAEEAAAKKAAKKAAEEAAAKKAAKKAAQEAEAKELAVKKDGAPEAKEDKN